MAPPRHHKQQQSLLFSKLPVDIRRHIYKQYWQIYGSTQHVFLFGNDSYLSHFPCLLEGKEFKQHCNPTPPKEDQPATDQAAADQPATNQPATNQPAADNDGDQPESHDEPGNINAAIQDILNNPPETPAGPAENGDDAAQLIDAVLSDESFTMEEILDDWEVIHSTNNDQPESHDDPGNVNAAIQDMINLEILHGGPGKWIKSPWCEHVHCVSAYVSTFDSIFELAYSRHFKRARRHPGHPLPTVGMTKPFHVCKRMYIEASESLFSNVRFSFDDLRALERFTKQLSPETANMVRSVELVLTAPKSAEDSGANARNYDRHQCPLPNFCVTLQDLLPNIANLSLTIHPHSTWTVDADTNVPRLPNKKWFMPLYQLAVGLASLDKFKVNLVAKFEEPERDEPQPVYGAVTPKHLLDAPFKTALVCPGWHGDARCTGFVVRGRDLALDLD